MNGFAFCLSALIFLTAGKGFAQCPVVLHCSAPTDTLCDASSNDSLLWNGSSFWDTLYQLHDLPEVPADLQLSVVDTCAGEFESKTPYYYSARELEDDAENLVVA